MYEEAKKRYAALGVDTERAMEILDRIPISMHCWQGDDVIGFDSRQALSGGIQATGNYPGRATTPEELMQDIDEALALIPGVTKLNLHASYAIFDDGEAVDRDAIEPKHFKAWVDFANERGLGLDFNPTFFSHPMVKDDLTLTSPDDEVRNFWIRHGIQSLKITDYLAKETGKPSLMNIWIPDGYKDVPADRLGPRRRYMESLDTILETPYDHDQVSVSLESKVFGIGLESYTAGSSEFCIGYAASRGITPLLDNGHYHPTERVSDKIASLLLFHDKLGLHITRPVRWDSDHVVLLDDETRAICQEIVRHDAIDRVMIGTDFFDASINRISAWVTGLRSVRKALLYALLEPADELKALQDEGDYTTLMVRQEQQKLLPMGAVWEEYLKRHDMPLDYLTPIRDYEKKVLVKR